MGFSGWPPATWPAPFFCFGCWAITAAANNTTRNTALRMKSLSPDARILAVLQVNAVSWQPSNQSELQGNSGKIVFPDPIPMIQLTGAAKRFGPKTLFENLDWLVTPNERVGIVGANGTGKSTLLKILAGMDGLDGGSMTAQKSLTRGYLPQEGLTLSGRTVFAECMTV